jgi:hypothetical protein
MGRSSEVEVEGGDWYVNAVESEEMGMKSDNRESMAVGEVRFKTSEG